MKSVGDSSLAQGKKRHHLNLHLAFVGFRSVRLSDMVLTLVGFVVDVCWSLTFLLSMLDGFAVTLGGRRRVVC